MWFIPSPGRVRGGVERIAKSRFVPFGGRVLGGVKRHRAMLTRGLTVRRKFLGPSSRSQAALDAEHHFIEESLRDGDGFGPAERPKDTQLGYSLELSIPRAELEQGAAGSVVFVVALTTYKEGITHAWQLRKRYSYFERLHRGVVAETAAAAGVSVPALPRRRLRRRRDPRRVAALREELQAYMHAVLALLQEPPSSLPLHELLVVLELPPARHLEDGDAWERASQASGST